MAERKLLYVLLAAAVSGCLTGLGATDESDSNVPGTVTSGALSFLVNIHVNAAQPALVDKQMTATEPSVEQAPDGTLWIAGPTGFVTPALTLNPRPYTHDAGLWSSTDAGATWEWNDPIPGYGRDACPGGGDSDIAFGADGAIFIADLWLGNADIITSHDGGQTWLCNPITSLAPGVDRQWIHTCGNDVYIAVNHLALGIRFLRAERLGLPTDALVFTQQTQLSGTNFGPFAVDPFDCTIYLVRNGNSILVSQNRGTSFQSRATSLPGGLHDFRGITVDDAGTVYVAGATNNGVAIAFSKDKGVTWSRAQLIAPYAGNYNFPWIVAGGNGVLDVAWYGRPNVAPPAGRGYYLFFAQATDVSSHPNGDATFTSMRLTERPLLTVDICLGLGCGAGRALGDFFEINLDAEGNALIAYNDAANYAPTAVLFAKQTAGPVAAL